MLTVEERALVNDLGDKLLELYDRRDDATFDGDSERVAELQIEIDVAKAEQEQIIRTASTL
jgi:hypothetical protein